MLKSLLADEVKVNITFDDIRLRSTLCTDKLFRFTKNFFFFSILQFTQSHSGSLGEIEGFTQLFPGTYINYKRNNNTGVEKVHLNCDCTKGANVNGVRQPILYSFGLTSPPAHKKIKEPRIKLFKRKNNTV